MKLWVRIGIAIFFMLALTWSIMVWVTYLQRRDASTAVELDQQAQVLQKSVGIFKLSK